MNKQELEEIYKGIGCSLTGHRTKDIFSKEDILNRKRTVLVMVIMKAFEKMILEENVTYFVTGGALESDQNGFIAAQYLKEKKYPHIKNILAIPYEDQPKSWIEQYQRVKKWHEEEKNQTKKENYLFQMKELEKAIQQYRKMLEVADAIVYVDCEEGYIPRGMPAEQAGKHSNQKLQLRNIYMLDKTDYVVAVWNGKENGGTYNCLKSAKKKEKKIYRINPAENFKAEWME